MKIGVGFLPTENKNSIPLLSQNRQFQYFSNPTYIYPLIPASAVTLLNKNKYNVAFLDCIVEHVSRQGFSDFIKKEEVSLFAFETKTPVIKEHWAFCNWLKQTHPDLILVVMGDHVTALPEETLENSDIDYVITGGDYDFQLLALCNYLTGKGDLPNGIWHKKNNKITNSGPFQLEHNLDELPIIDRELTKSHLYNIEYNIRQRPFLYTMAGRDCPYHKCKFCSWTTLFPKFRVRSVNNFISEIESLVSRYRVKAIFDDTGTFPRGDWLENFCNAMIKTRLNTKISFSCNFRLDWISKDNANLMKKAGFDLLKVGLESANQETLDKLNKGTKVQQIIDGCKAAKSAGLNIHLTIMVGFPWEREQDALNTLTLAQELMCTAQADILQSTLIVPYPGTPLYNECIKNDWFLIDPKDYEKFDMSEPILRTKDMNPQQIKNICQSIYKIYTNPRYICKRLGSIRSLNDLLYNLRGLKAVLGHLQDFRK
ncbi:B12-binding domain-containing radical SAM protein [bacterium]|nr:B12-binding domain-containing radical SAM protein [bacterium]